MDYDTIAGYILPFHRFYVGKIWTGILFWLTAGGFVIWYIIDIVMILLDQFTDKERRKLKNNFLY